MEQDFPADGGGGAAVILPIYLWCSYLCLSFWYRPARKLNLPHPASHSEHKNRYLQLGDYASLTVHLYWCQSRGNWQDHPITYTTVDIPLHFKPVNVKLLHDMKNIPEAEIYRHSLGIHQEYRSYGDDRDRQVGQKGEQVIASRFFILHLSSHYHFLAN